MASGQRLVLGKEVTPLVLVPDAYDVSRQAIGIVDNGRIVIEGTVDEMQHSSHPLARAFLGSGAD